jgi:hypothetical protein
MTAEGDPIAETSNEKIADSLTVSSQPKKKRKKRRRRRRRKVGKSGTKCWRRHSLY